MNRLKNFEFKILNKGTNGPLLCCKQTTFDGGMRLVKNFKPRMPNCQNLENLCQKHPRVKIFNLKHRVPGIMSWPGKISANQISNSVSGLMDIFTTSLALANIPLPLKVVNLYLNYIKNKLFNF